jgi:hypothetical protein
VLCTCVKIRWAADTSVPWETLAAFVKRADPVFDEFDYEVEARNPDTGWAHWIRGADVVAVRLSWESDTRERWTMGITGEMSLELAGRLLALADEIVDGA